MCRVPCALLFACFAATNIHLLVLMQCYKNVTFTEFENTVIVTGNSNPQHLTMPSAEATEEAIEARKHQHAEVQSWFEILAAYERPDRRRVSKMQSYFRNLLHYAATIC